MAKSIRSKRMRKLRAIKRTRNAPREAKRLKKILGLLKPEEDDPEKNVYKFSDVRDMILNKPTVNQASGTAYDLRFVPDRDKIKTDAAQPEETTMDDDTENKSVTDPERQETMEAMEEDGEAKPKQKGLQNEHGNYPIWMSHRRIKKITRKGRPNQYKLKRAGTGKTF
ncbi:protein LLP homolog [Acanthaster planci]|uniref:Protein LLP homolog n=1 Tax=Acanthaster planci TaxID=133434 RepID=A0A8B7ZE58_ACAPL|nr:protein LLP homolog [Acanthaster planci]